MNLIIFLAIMYGSWTSFNSCGCNEQHDIKNKKLYLLMYSFKVIDAPDDSPVVLLCLNIFHKNRKVKYVSIILPSL